MTATAVADDLASDPIVRQGEPGYDQLRSGFNTVIEHHPRMIVDAASPSDVIRAVRLAAAADCPVAVMNTGHGPSMAADGAVMIRTRRMQGVQIDPVRRTARIEAGVSWHAVIEAAAPYGLAPLNGSSPAVGAVGYTLGGGVGLLARRFGFAADHVRWLDVDTANGPLHRVSADATSEPDLFWAMRGAGANFGVVTAMEVDLFPVGTLLGGELCFGPELCESVLYAYADWARAVPETMASSVLLVRYPDDAAVPDGLRGRHITHVRVAYSGCDPADGYRWVAPLRRIGDRVLDTVRLMPYAEVGTIHHEPTDAPVPACDRNLLLRDFDHEAAAVLCAYAGPAAALPFVAELRAWGGALSRPPSVPNAIAGRDAAYSLIGISDPVPRNRARRDELLEAMQPWATGRTYMNFSGVEDELVEAVRRMYQPEDFVRLQEVKATYDADNVFRVNFNIPPRTGAR